MGEKRLTSIDIAKAICIVLVVVGHYHPDNSPEWYTIINHLIYSFHMPLFMFASGYVYIATKRNEKYGSFMWKKIKRLLIPYFSASIIVISIKLASQQGLLVENPVTWYSYFKMFYLPEAGYFLWFIWALFGIFLIVPLVKTTQGRTLLFILSLLIGFIPLRLPEIFCISQLVGMLKYFMFGVFLYEHSYWIEKAKNLPLILPSALFIILFSLSQYHEMKIYSSCFNLLLPYVGIYAVSMVSIGINRNHEKATGIFLFISSSSYVIYLFHTTFEGFMKSFIHKIPILVDANNSIMFGIGAVLIIACGVIGPVFLHHIILAKNTVLRICFGLK
jgi:fucose 4-O-acetylase-like acetyltransferase